MYPARATLQHVIKAWWKGGKNTVSSLGKPLSFVFPRFLGVLKWPSLELRRKFISLVQMCKIIL